MSLVALAASWALLVIVGYVPKFGALGEHGLVDSVQLSGSSLTTLGFVAADGLPETLLAVSEALLGLCALVEAPPTPWSSDRMHRFRRPRGLGRWRWEVEPRATPPSW